MANRLWLFIFLAAASLATLRQASASDLKVLETGPPANGVINTLSDGFFVRFDQPVDHINSRLLVRRGSETVETLQPRLQSDPAVLFARAPSLPPGRYTLHWVVKTIQDARIEEGDVPFSIGRRE
jgi:methionine-rich copper-binding protein CopC